MKVKVKVARLGIQWLMTERNGGMLSRSLNPSWADALMMTEKSHQTSLDTHTHTVEPVFTNFFSRWYVSIFAFLLLMSAESH